MINKAVKLRIYPNKKQKEQFQNNFGACRFVYNNILDRLKKLYQHYPGQYRLNIKLINTFLNQLKEENSFLYNVESTSLQQSSRDLYKSYINFFKNPKTRSPRFHSKKKTRLSFRQTIHDNLVQGVYLKLRKYGKIRYRTSKEYINLLNNPDVKFNNVTVACDNGEYYAIINIMVDDNVLLDFTGACVGFDVNSNRNGWLVCSNGDKYRFDINHENQMIKYLNRQLALKKKGSRSFKRLQRRLWKYYNKRTNKLWDYIHKLSNYFVKYFDTVVFEDNLNSIKILIGGEQNSVFPLIEFISLLKYKFDWYKPDAPGVVFVNPKYTSKTCNVCGYVHNSLDVNTRYWICPECGSGLDRDVNAAINILNRWDNGDGLV